MKKHLFYIGIIILFVCTSCAAPKYSVVNISGTPGTKIYASAMSEKPLGEIPLSGTLELQIDNKYNIYDVLFAHDAISNMRIPFALNYTKHKYSDPAVYHAGLGLGIAGSSLAFGSVTTFILDAASAGLAILIPSLAISGAGWGMLGTYKKNAKNLLYKNNFDYLPDQVTNQDLTFTMPEYEYEPRIVPVWFNEQEEQDNKSKSEVSTIKLRDNTKTIVGMYKGTCSISQDGEDVDQIDNIRLNLVRINNTTVSGVVLNAQGEELIGNAAEFQVRKKDGHFILTNKTNDNVTIDIDANGNLIYSNPSVMIEGSIYQIQVKANKDQGQ